jgi:hypothetical protein
MRIHVCVRERERSEGQPVSLRNSVDEKEPGDLYPNIREMFTKSTAVNLKHSCQCQVQRFLIRTIRVRRDLMYFEPNRELILP